MRSALAAATLALLVTGAALGSAVPAQAQQAYLYGQKKFGHACRPPLKYAAGACVRRCPAGYRTMGNYCRMQDNRR